MPDPAAETLAPPGGAALPPVDDIPAALREHPRYRVIRLLGRGGMGAVYLAEHRVMERPVALKVIRADLTGSVGAVDRFHREVKAAAQLHHPNIVTAHDAEQVGDTHYLVMEYVPGIDLAHVVMQQGPLPVAEACNAVRQAALGLQHAFDKGMIHRDVKPQNLMRTPDGTVKILDFGLARLAGAAGDGQTASGVLLGTVDFMAPEQADNAKAADTRSDIYSLGCTLYYLLSGRVPFPDGSLVQRVMAHVEKTPPSLATFRSDLPPDLLRVLSRMMAKSPRERYQTPAEVATALEPFTKLVSAAPTLIQPRPVGIVRTVTATDVPEVLPVVEAIGPVPVSRSRRPDSRSEPKPVLPAKPRRSPWFLGCLLLGLATIASLTYLGYHLVTTGIDKIGGSIQQAIKEEQLKSDAWTALESTWIPPAENVDPANLFPQKVGDASRVKLDPKGQAGTVAELDIAMEGWHAEYQATGGRWHVNAYRVNSVEKEAIYGRILRRVSPSNPPGANQGFRSVNGSITSARIVFHVNDPFGGMKLRGVAWWNRGWLFLVRTETSTDPDPLLRRYLEAINAPPN
jgi:serine/threonine protein kinase